MTLEGQPPETVRMMRACELWQGHVYLFFFSKPSTQITRASQRYKVRNGVWVPAATRVRRRASASVSHARRSKRNKKECQRPHTGGL